MFRSIARSRVWILFALLFGLIAVEGGVGLYVLSDFRQSVAELRTIHRASMQIDEFGLLLNNFVKEMMVSTGIGQQGLGAVPLPPTVALGEGAAALAAIARTVKAESLGHLLTGVEELRGAVAEYSRSLARGERDEATLAYIQTIEPLADRLLSKDFPATRRAILGEVARVGETNERAGAFARRVVGVTLAATLAVGLLLFRLILASLRTTAAQERELERRASELAIARSIQTSVLPHDLDLPGYDVGAVMLAAEEVGGDFYEFRRAQDGGAWIAVGDVTGHGVRSGLVMLMAQSMFTMLSEDGDETPSPKRLLERLNRALFFNLRDRLREDGYMTIVVAHLFPDGRLVYAGAHTDLLVYRHADDRVERVPTEGVWIGLVEDVSEATVEREVRLAAGDVALFHTDGVTEARDSQGRIFDVDRLAEHLKAASDDSARALVGRLAAVARQWAPVPADDMSLMAIKRS